MTCALSNEESHRIVGRIGMGATMAATWEGYRIRIPVGPHITKALIEERLPEIEDALMADGYKVGSRRFGRDDVTIHLGWTPEQDNRLMFFEGRMSRIDRTRTGAVLALLDDTIVPLDLETRHVALSRDGDRVSVGYRRMQDGSVAVGGFRNHELPHEPDTD